MDRIPTALQKQMKRFWRYTLSSSLTFLIDLSLLFLFTDIFHLYYLISAAISFSIAISFNYVLARRYAFEESTRGRMTGYLVFLSIALVGLLIITTGMYILVETVHLSYLPARIVIALVAGLWNFLMNSLVNFRA